MLQCCLTYLLILAFFVYFYIDNYIVYKQKPLYLNISKLERQIFFLVPDIMGKALSLLSFRKIICML